MLIQSANDMNMSVIIKTFDQLNTYELYAILALRSQIFVVEQNCVYQDPDGEADFQSWHFMVWREQKLAAYLRIIPAHDDVPTKIGRVVVSPNYRGKGFARLLMQSAVEYCHAQNIHTIFLQAQTYLIDFYCSFGFQTISQEYLEDGIPHTDMLLNKPIN